MNDMNNFKKLTPENQVELAEAFILTLPKEQQENARKIVFGK